MVGLLSECAHEAGRQADVLITTELPEHAHVLGNATDLKRVFANLVENARKYGKTPGSDVAEVDIKCTVRGMHTAKRVIVEVQDHGVGVPPEQIAQLLKPFTRLDTARGQANGAGLGLAIVDRVLSRHEAELEVANREGGGLKFTITLRAL